MSNIQKRPSGKWRARYRDGSGREHARHFARKVDAVQWLALQQADVVRGRHVDPRAGKVTFGAFAAEWQARQVASEATARVTDNALRLHLVPRLGARTLASLQKSDVQAAVKALSQTLAPGSVHNVYDVLRRVMEAAVDDGLIPGTPCRKVDLPARVRSVTPPTAAQVNALIDAVPRRWQVLPLLLSQSGLRIGEALGLRPDDVDFLRRQVLVERQRTQDGSLGPTKSRRPRTVPLSDQVVAALAEHLAEYGRGEWLFTTELGEPLTYRAWRVVWDGARKAAGAEGVRAHGLRHYAASMLLSRRASLPQVSAVLGHSSATVTLRTYSHLMPGDTERTRELMNEAFGGRDEAPNDRSSGASGETAADSLRTEGMPR